VGRGPGMRHPATGMDDLDQSIDALYAGPPGEFTAGRDALAKDLRAAGDQDAAARVRQLRRPTKIAAELNRLARGEPGAMGAAIDAEGALGEAQRGVLEGTATADDLRAAELHEAAAIAALSSDPAIRAALRLAARSPDGREDLRRGRISQDPVPDPGAALFGMGPVSVPPGTSPTPPAREPTPAPPQEDELAAVRAKRERASARQAAEATARAAARAERAAQEKLTKARRRATQAGTEARRAAEALERVTRELAQAQAQLSAKEDEARAAAEAEAGAESAAQEAAVHRQAADRAARDADEGGRPA
jgi:hypothetical protein